MPVLDILALKQALPAGGRLLAIDVGSKTLGLAISDSALKVAAPLETFARGRFAADAARLKALVGERGVGGFILQWSLAEAGRRGRRFVRLDCHAGNPWLCGYYESHGFTFRGRVEQHPGYIGCLYQRAVPPQAGGPSA